MTFLEKLRQLINVGRSQHIARRYLVVNGFDGALTTLGLLIGFFINNVTDLKVSITACIGAAIALGMSGFSSAYISEAAEQKKVFNKLQEAMVTDISGSTHEMASRWMPFLIAAVNGCSPLLISLVIILPLWLHQTNIIFIAEPLLLAIAIAFGVIFFLGVFLSKISGSFWLISGLQALLIATITSLIIYLIT